MVTWKNHSEDLGFNFKTTPPRVHVVMIEIEEKKPNPFRNDNVFLNGFLQKSNKKMFQSSHETSLPYSPFKKKNVYMTLHCFVLHQNLCGCLFFLSLEWNRISWQLGHFQRMSGRERWGKGGLCQRLRRGRSQRWRRWWWWSVLWLWLVRSIYRFGNVWNDEI